MAAKPRLCFFEHADIKRVCFRRAYSSYLFLPKRINITFSFDILSPGLCNTYSVYLNHTLLYPKSHTVTTLHCKRTGLLSHEGMCWFLSKPKVEGGNTNSYREHLTGACPSTTQYKAKSDWCTAESNNQKRKKKRERLWQEQEEQSWTGKDLVGVDLRSSSRTLDIIYENKKWKRFVKS